MRQAFSSIMKLEVVAYDFAFNRETETAVSRFRRDKDREKLYRTNWLRILNSRGVFTNLVCNFERRKMED